MKISVIILTFNRVVDTLALLASLTSQCMEDFEIIIVDNGSTDGTLIAVAAAHPRVRCIGLVRNVGVPAGRNMGAAHAKGEYFVFLDNDSEVRDDEFLLKIADSFHQFPDAGALGFQVFAHSTGELDESTWVWSDALRGADSPEIIYAFVGAGFAVRSEVFKEVGGFCESLFFMHEEKELCMRMLRRNYVIYYIPGIALYHKVSAENRCQKFKRDFYYGVRNSIWIGLRNYPFFVCCKAIFGLLVSSFFYSLKRKTLSNFFKGVFEGIVFSRPALQLRNPLSSCQLSDFYGRFYPRKESFLQRLKRFLK